MYRVLTDTAEKVLLSNVRLGIISPVIVAAYVVAYIIAIFFGLGPGFLSWISYIPFAIHVALTGVWLVRLLHYLHRLKGKPKEEFLRLYRHLYDCTEIGNFVGIAITIEYIAALVDDEYSEVYQFLLQYAGSFLTGAQSLPLRMPDLSVLIDIMYILRKVDLIDLPGHLTSESYWLRDAASLRLGELQSAVQ